MVKYQTSQLEAASEILELYGLSHPYTLPEKIRVIETARVLASAKIEATVGNYRVAIRRTIDEIKQNRRRQKCSNPPEICVIDWRDDSEHLLWV
ncbi:MAG TPA: hypothetical protein V6D33_01935 [Cyanophyceae cyanobacterium]